MRVRIACYVVAVVHLLGQPVSADTGLTPGKGTYLSGVVVCVSQRLAEILATTHRDVGYHAREELLEKFAQNPRGSPCKRSNWYFVPVRSITTYEGLSFPDGRGRRNVYIIEMRIPHAEFPNAFYALSEEPLGHPA